MDQLFWLLPGQVAGRAGPDDDPWHLPTLRQQGIRAILSVNDGRGCDPQACAALDIAYACTPLSDWVPPQPGDAAVCLAALPRGYHFVHTQLTHERPVLVHCSGGNDRTGLFLAYFLVQYAKLTPEHAVATVRAVRPSALRATGWTAFAYTILRQTI